MSKFQNFSLSSLLISAHLIFSYYYFNGWWYSSIGTLLILIFSFFLWRKEFLIVSGLKIRLKTLLKTTGFAVLVLLLSYLIISFISGKYGIAIQFSGFDNYYHDVFYILNEEIVFGAIPVFILLNKYKLNKISASAGLALIFSIGHFVFYKWVFQQAQIIELKTLIVLFFVAIVRNNLIIIKKHIGYSWALHFGWMAIMFGSFPYHIDSGEVLTEPERFNLFLGSNEMLVISFLLAIYSIFYIAGNKPETVTEIN